MDVVFKRAVDRVGVVVGRRKWSCRKREAVYKDEGSEKPAQTTATTSSPVWFCIVDDFWK